MRLCIVGESTPAKLAPRSTQRAHIAKRKSCQNHVKVFIALSKTQHKGKNNHRDLMSSQLSETQCRIQGLGNESSCGRSEISKTHLNLGMSTAFEVQLQHTFFETAHFGSSVYVNCILYINSGVSKSS